MIDDTMFLVKKIGACSVPQKELEKWIYRHFNYEKDLSDFSVREFNGAIELFSEDGSKGYVFVQKNNFGKDYGKKALELRETYEGNLKKDSSKYFCSTDFELAGFDWRN